MDAGAAAPVVVNAIAARALTAATTSASIVTRLPVLLSTVMDPPPDAVGCV
jgi:hypothetical protein